MVGETARELFDDAQKMLTQIIADKSLTLKGVYGFFPCRADGDTIRVFEPNTAGSHEELARFETLRQQWERKEQHDFRSLADYIAPHESGKTDYIGAFAVTSGHGCKELVAKYKQQLDDPAVLLVEALADRLARPLPSTCTNGLARIGALVRQRSCQPTK